MDVDETAGLFDDDMDQEELDQIQAEQTNADMQSGLTNADIDNNDQDDDELPEEPVDLEEEGIDMSNVVQGGRSSRRRGRTRSKKTSSALQELKALRQQGVNRSNVYEVEDAERVYDVINETEYTEIVNKHRQEDTFVVDDEEGASGYLDYGEEIDWRQGYDDGFEFEKRRRGKPKRKSGSKRKTKKEAEPVEPVADPRQRVSALFAAKATDALGVGGPASKREREPSEQIDLDDMLAEFTGDSSDRSSTKIKKRRLAADLELETMNETSSSALTSGRRARQKMATNPQDFGGHIPSLMKQSGPQILNSQRSKLDPYAAPPPMTEEEKQAREQQKLQEELEDQERALRLAEIRAGKQKVQAKQEPSMVLDDFQDDAGVPDDEDVMEVAGSKVKVNRPSADWWKLRSEMIGDDAMNLDSDNANSGNDDSSSSSSTNNFDFGADGFGSMNSSENLSGGSLMTSGKSTTLDVDTEDDDALRFYYLDACEKPTQNAFANSATVYMFGKVFNPDNGQHLSACVTVQGIQRVLHVLPRLQGDDLDDEARNEVATEFAQVLTKLGVKPSQASFEWVEKNYAFEEVDVPRVAEYLEVILPADIPTMPRTKTGNTFSRIFGTNTSTLELLLMELKLMGPGWLNVKNAQLSNVNQTWCKMQMVVDSPNCISKGKRADPPPLRVMSLHVKTILNHRAKTNDIVSFSAIVHRQVNVNKPTSEPQKQYVQFNAIRSLDTTFPRDFKTMVKENNINLEICQSERQLLSYLLTRIHTIDPDVIVGHNFIGFDLDVLLHRLQHHKIPMWSKLGRLNRKRFPKMQKGAGGTTDSTYQERAIMCGRLVVDTYLQARDLIRESSYSLASLRESQLPRHPIYTLEADKIVDSFNSTQGIMMLMQATHNFAFLSIELMFKLLIIPLTHQLTCLAGNLWSRTLTGGRAERNEFLLCHEFHLRNYVKPDKITWIDRKREQDEMEMNGGSSSSGSGSSKSGRKKPKYEGGLVLEPKRGLYDTHVLLLDFNSLYPSIIQEYNICFTTVTRPQPDEEGNIPMAKVPSSDMEKGVLPTVLENLINSRAQVKSLIKKEKGKDDRDNDKLEELDIRSRALKLTANSMYGCLGFTMSRFYAPSLAALITSKGREILQKTQDVANDELNLDVIYGDTDSIMVDTKTKNIKETHQIGHMVMQAINKRYKKLVIDIDGVYESMLLLRKKKYAATMVDSKGRKKIEMKGIDSVRRDWCGLSKEISNFCLNVILSGQSRDSIVEQIHDYLRSQNTKIMAKDQIPMGKYIIQKSLTKAIENYANSKSLPHVNVAKALLASGKSVRVGDIIPYVIVEGESSQIADRAVHPDEVMNSGGKLQLDLKWYLANQVLPPVSRLCAVIEGTDQAQLADCLGLDSSKYHDTSMEEDGDEPHFVSVLQSKNASHMFKECNALRVKCAACGFSEEFQGPVAMAVNGARRNGLRCAKCADKYETVSLWNQAKQVIRRAQMKFYLGEFQCDDNTCGIKTRQLSTLDGGARCLQAGCSGTLKPVFTATDLDKQLRYFKFLFDTSIAKESQGDVFNACFANADDLDEFEDLKNAMSNVLSKSAYFAVSPAVFDVTK